MSASGGKRKEDERNKKYMIGSVHQKMKEIEKKQSNSEKKVRKGN